MADIKLLAEQAQMDVERLRIQLRDAQEAVANIEAALNRSRGMVDLLSGLVQQGYTISNDNNAKPAQNDAEQPRVVRTGTFDASPNGEVADEEIVMQE